MTTTNNDRTPPLAYASPNSERIPPIPSSALWLTVIAVGLYAEAMFLPSIDIGTQEMLVGHRVAHTCIQLITEHGAKTIDVLTANISPLAKIGVFGTAANLLFLSAAGNCLWITLRPQLRKKSRWRLLPIILPACAAAAAIKSIAMFFQSFGSSGSIHFGCYMWMTSTVVLLIAGCLSAKGSLKIR